MLASANVNTDTFINVFRHASKGDFIKAKQTFDSLVPIIKRLFQESNPSPLKWILAQQGMITSTLFVYQWDQISKQLQSQLERMVKGNVFVN